MLSLMLANRWSCQRHAGIHHRGVLRRLVCTKVMPTVTVFGGPHCSLCDDMKEVLGQSRRQFRLETIDISDKKQHMDYFRRYKWDIPVLHIDGKFAFKHRMQLADFEVAMEEAERGSFVERAGEPDSRGKTYDEQET